jgi:hypothetical protein
MVDSKIPPRRKYVRFRPDPMDHALIAINNTDEPFTPDHVALILDEAPMGGCALVLMDVPLLVQGVRVRVKVGRMDPVLAELCWRKELEHGLVRVGLRYLE